VGLIKLADKNLVAAKQNLEMENYEGAIQTASTSVENIARALIHCFGGKPDPESGQEEALKMLSRMFRGEEKDEFEKAIEAIAYINCNKKILECLPADIRIQLFNEAKMAAEIVKSASKIVNLFKQMNINIFAAEIPELVEV
jgi:uncharacterized protein (UPF0332 family)